MYLLSVLFSEISQYAYDRIDKEVRYFDKEGIVIEKHTEKQGKNECITFGVDESSLKNYSKNDFQNIFKHYLANAFSDIIIQYEETKLAAKILQEQYYYFSPVERESILGHLENVLKSEEYKYHEGVTYRISRKAKILQQIMDYLKENDFIHLDGFIRFRLKSYILELEDSVDKAVEDFLMEKEYNEFIRLLKYFVDIQEAKIDTINVLIHEDGKYHLFDKLRRSINNEHIEDLAAEMLDNEIGYDDLLISSLITIAPKKITIHYTGKIYNKEIIKTIKNVFSDRVNVCNGCDFCALVQHVKEE
jgi:putative sporulation protein YtxC